MHPSLRLLVCRCGFVLFALLPTLVVGGWIIRRGLPEYALAQRTEWERELSQRLGLTVAVDKLEYPQPGVARLVGVQLTHTETGDAVATIREVEIAQTDDTYVIEASQPIVDVRQLALLGPSLHDRLMQAWVNGSPNCELLASDVTLQQEGQAVTLGELIGVVSQSPSGDPSVDLEFTVPSASGQASRGTISLVRNRQMRPPVTRWELQTGEAPLPGWLIVDAMPALKQLGSNAQFAGAATWMQLPEGLNAEFAGRIFDVDFDSLVSEQLPHQLSGWGTFDLQSAKIERGQLVELRGDVQSRDGLIGPSLLAAASEHLGVQVPLELVADTNRAVPYRQLSIGFHLTDRALLLRGGCDVLHPGVAIANAAGPVVEVPPQHSTAAVNVLRTLLPESEWQVPATRQTGSLAAMLPVPDLAPEVTARRNAHTPTRLAPATGGTPLRQPR